MKKTHILLLLLFLGANITVYSQKFVWKAGLHSFFDNNEFSGSEVQISQTMAGVHVVPQIGLSFNNKHLAFVGIDVMHEFGSNKVIDFYDAIAYYQYDGDPFTFYMGAFPRKPLLDHYPRMFFNDSIHNYRPTLNGLFWEYRSQKDDYLNVWLDWTGRQTTEVNEAFFMGWSGRYNLGVFYGQHLGYMYHFAAKLNPEIPEGLHDNGLTLTSLGVDFGPKTNFEKLGINAGWSVALERDRSFGDWHAQQGFLSEINVEYKGLGLFNTLYLGNKQQLFFGDHGNKLYWGDRMYQLKQYNRTDFYICFFKTDAVDVKLTYSLHFAESNVFHSQSLYAKFNLDNLQKKKQKSYEYIWSNWF